MGADNENEKTKIPTTENAVITFVYAFDTYYRRIYQFCVSLIQDDLEAEDLTMDTFEKLLKLFPQFKTETNVRAFLYITSRNACLDCLRRRKTRTAILEVIKYHEDLQKHIEEDYLDGFFYESVLAAIEQLPDRQKAVIKKLYIEELDHVTVAEQLNIKIDSVYSVRSRAVVLLRKLIFTPGLPDGLVYVGMAAAFLIGSYDSL